MQYGDPRCRTCRGTGYTREWGWRIVRCHCVRPSRATAQVVQRANERADRKRMTVADMIRVGNTAKERQTDG